MVHPLLIKGEGRRDCSWIAASRRISRAKNASEHNLFDLGPMKLTSERPSEIGLEIDLSLLAVAIQCKMRRREIDVILSP